jgi:hypothetical protein
MHDMAPAQMRKEIGCAPEAKESGDENTLLSDDSSNIKFGNGRPAGFGSGKNNRQTGRHVPTFANACANTPSPATSHNVCAGVRPAEVFAGPDGFRGG